MGLLWQLRGWGRVLLLWFWAVATLWLSPSNTPTYLTSGVCVRCIHEYVTRLGWLEHYKDCSSLLPHICLIFPKRCFDRAILVLTSDIWSPPDSKIDPKYFERHWFSTTLSPHLTSGSNFCCVFRFAVTASIMTVLVLLYCWSLKCFVLVLFTFRSWGRLNVLQHTVHLFLSFGSG